MTTLRPASLVAAPAPDLRASRADPLARVLELGLAVVIVVGPWPLGAVPPAGRLTLEGAALALSALWAVRALRHPTSMPHRAVWLAGLGLLFLALLQAAVLPQRLVEAVSPRAAAIRASTLPPEDIRQVENRLLGAETVGDGPRSALSLDPPATVSSARTGAALVALLLVATTVAAVRGGRGLALALLVSAGFQGLYGLLVLVSGAQRIWHLPKLHNLDAATGTFVNKNHFACLLAMALCGGGAWLVDRARRRPTADRAAHALVEALGPVGGPRVLAVALLIAGLAGLLASFSRAGTAIGLAGLAAVALVSAPARSWRRSVVILLIAAAALVPLTQRGADRLVHGYLAAAGDLRPEGGRVSVWSDTVDMARAFPVAGSGYGSFAAVYPLFRSPDVRKFYRHAHNDPLQALAEGGLLGGALLLALLIPLLAVCRRGLAGQLQPIGTGFAAGLAAFGLHSLVDFNAHVPANAAVAAILAGALLGLPSRRRTPLVLLQAPPDGDAPRRSPAAPLCAGALLFCAGLATLGGADAARATADPGETAREAVALALERGAQADAVRDRLRELRAGLRARPLDSKARVAYAGLLSSLAASTDELRAAVFHARLALRLAPVTVPVVRAALLVLVRAGESAEAAAGVREMFAYDPRAAARLLARIEPLLAPEQIRDAVPDAAEAWRAWAWQLLEAGRGTEADRWLDEGRERWPDDLGLRVQAAERASRRDDWERLAVLVDTEDPLPAVAEAASLFVHRARIKARRGDADGARADLRRALDLDRSPATLLRAGDGFAAVGDVEPARVAWTRARFALAGGAPEMRAAVLRRLARLEQEQGRAGTALRLWRELLVLRPDDDEALGSVARIGGTRP